MTTATTTAAFNFTELDEPGNKILLAVGLDEAGEVVAHTWGCTHEPSECKCVGNWTDGDRAAAARWMERATLAQQFKAAHAFQTENNGHAGEDLDRHPASDEAEELHDPSSCGWRFPDGSELWLVPGQVASTVFAS